MWKISRLLFQAGRSFKKNIMSQIATVLQQLIEEKYNSFETGCIIVAQWINGEAKSNISDGFIQGLCNGTMPADAIIPEYDIALRKLFGISIT